MRIRQRYVGAAWILFALWLMNGCITPMPETTTASSQQSRAYMGTYDKVWGAVIAALQNEDINMNAVDKNAGIVNGIKNLDAATGDILLGYSTRILVNITVQQAGDHQVKVAIRSREERKYKNRDWRPARDASTYAEALYTKIGANVL